MPTPTPESPTPEMVDAALELAIQCIHYGATPAARGDIRTIEWLRAHWPDVVRDAERLTFLEDVVMSDEWTVEAGRYSDKQDRTFCVIRYGADNEAEGRNLRDALDAARAQQKEQT